MVKIKDATADDWAKALEALVERDKKENKLDIPAEKLMDLVGATASYTKHCKEHNRFYSSDLVCPECPSIEERVKKWMPENLEKFNELALGMSEVERGKPLPVEQSTRYNNGKVQTREVYPDFIMGIGDVLTASRAKYEHYNWCKPTKLSTPYESAMRHLMQFQSGEDFDKESGKHHLLHVATNIMFMYYHITNNPEESDDRFFKKDKK